MTSKRLLSARDFFEEVTVPAYDRFMREPSTFLTTYSLAYGLFHLHEWLWHYKKAEIQAKFGTSITTAGKFWKHVVEAQVSDAGLIRDMHNAAKHVEITRDPSTTMLHSANTHIVFSSVGGNGSVTLDEGGREALFDDLATRLMDFWRPLVNELDPQPSMVLPPSHPSANS